MLHKPLEDANLLKNVSDFDLSLQFSVSLLPSVKLFSLAAVFDALSLALEPERVEDHPLSKILVLCTYLFVRQIWIVLCWINVELLHQVQVLSVQVRENDYDVACRHQSTNQTTDKRDSIQYGSNLSDMNVLVV